MPQATLFLLYGVITFGLSLILTKLIMKIKVMDMPGERSSHSMPTPKSGGLAIIASVFLVILGAYAYGTFVNFPAKPILVVSSTSLFIAFIGFVDDIKQLSWITRLLTQSIMALTVVLAGATIPSLPLPFLGTVPLGIWGDVLAIVWILALTNAFNFMDGINGISGVAALIACITLLFNVYVDSLLIFTIGLFPFAILGFLIFNFPNAKIFLGDVGSQFLGFLFASLGLMLPLYEISATPWVMPMLFFIYLFETSVTIVRRLLKREHIFSAHREHFYQLLVRSGWSHAQVTLLYGIFFTVQGIVSYWMTRAPSETQLYFFIPVTLLYSVYAISVIKYAQKKAIN